MLEILFITLVIAVVFGMRIQARKTLLDLQRQIEVMKTQVRIADEKLAEKQLTNETYNQELIRKYAHIDQLCMEAKAKDDEIYVLKEEKAQMQDKLDHYRPVQGPGGRFIKKAIATT